MRAVHPTRLSLTLMITLVISGCFGGSGSGRDDTSIGRVNYNGFSGLTYTTASQTGTTSKQGEFHYYPGETLKLKVGDLLVAEGVPAREYVTPLEFFTSLRASLTNSSVNDQGLSTHTDTEQKVLDDVSLTNLVRFLISLNWTVNALEGQGIDIRARVIQQLNAKLPELTAPVDFNVGAVEFTATGKTPSPANQLLAAICFYPKDHELCEAPPTQADIDTAPERPENEDEWMPDTQYKQDLIEKRTRIIESVRSMDDIDAEDARTYMTRELKQIGARVANRFLLSPSEVSHPASDTSLKTLEIRRIGGNAQVADLEAISLRPQEVVVHATNRQAAEVEYFIAGDAGGESELIVNFRPVNTYRWVQKTLRVIID